MCISTGNFDSIFFLGVTPFLNFEIWRKWKILLKQFVSTTRLKPLNRIAWNFVIMKDIMSRYAFFTENTDLILLRSNLYPLFCPIACHLELPFIIYSILKQCWSVGYVSLLTLSFIFSSFSPEPLGQFQPNLVPSILGLCSNRGPCPFPREIITK